MPCDDQRKTSRGQRDSSPADSVATAAAWMLRMKLSVGNMRSLPLQVSLMSAAAIMAALLITTVPAASTAPTSDVSTALPAASQSRTLSSGWIGAVLPKLGVMALGIAGGMGGVFLIFSGVAVNRQREPTT